MCDRCNTVSGNHNQFCANAGSGVRFSKCHCGGREPYSFVGIGQTFCQGNYSSSFCCGILSWRFDDFKSRIDNGCCYFSMGCCCPSSWGLPFSYAASGRFTCFGSGVNAADFYLVQTPYWSYGCGPAYACCRWFFPAYTVSQLANLQMGTSGYPLITCSAIDITNSVIAPSTGPVQTGGTTCLSGLDYLFYNEKTCKHWGRSLRYPCAYCTPGTNISSMSPTTYEFCYCTAQNPIAHASSTNCSPLTCITDPQRFTANTVPFNAGTDQCSAVLYGVSTLGPGSPVFMLPNITSPVTGLAYYIKS